ncbi:hypothetical protein COO60DRAFT_1112377 [Scenedesmus sp. NREL 46B-D3]|nr:hypothetical protein COO60DRAFT_1112377 [Scenedesmus sp. NREL 46B-D3]
MMRQMAQGVNGSAAAAAAAALAMCRSYAAADGSGVGGGGGGADGSGASSRHAWCTGSHSGRGSMSGVWLVAMAEVSGVMAVGLLMSECIITRCCAGLL